MSRLRVFLVGFTVQEGAVSDDGVPDYPLTAVILGFLVFLVSRRHSYLRKL